jgi:hypothetical protein
MLHKWPWTCVWCPQHVCSRARHLETCVSGLWEELLVDVLRLFSQFFEAACVPQHTILALLQWNDYNMMNKSWKRDSVLLVLCSCIWGDFSRCPVMVVAFGCKLLVHFSPSLHRKLRELLAAVFYTYKNCTRTNTVACMSSNPQWHSWANVEQINSAAIIRLCP